MLPCSTIPFSIVFHSYSTFDFFSFLISLEIWVFWSFFSLWFFRVVGFGLPFLVAAFIRCQAASCYAGRLSSCRGTAGSEFHLRAVVLSWPYGGDHLRALKNRLARNTLLVWGVVWDRGFEKLPRWHCCLAQADKYHQRGFWPNCFIEHSNILLYAYIHMISFLIWHLHSQLWKVSPSAGACYFTFSWVLTCRLLQEWRGRCPAEKNGDGFCGSNGILNSFQPMLFRLLSPSPSRQMGMPLSVFES